MNLHFSRLAACVSVLVLRRWRIRSALSLRLYAQGLTLTAVLLTAGRLPAQDDLKLQQTVQAIAAAHHGKVTLFAEDLKTGQTVAIEPDQPVPTASIIKLPILYEALEQVREGKVSLDDPLTMKKADQVPGSGVLQFFDTPMTLTLRDALAMMIIESDNTATNLVIDHIGLASVNTRIAALGLRNTYLYKKVFQPAQGPMPPDQKQFGLGKTTAREISLVMQKLVTCDLAEPGHPAAPGDAVLCGFVLHILTSQSDRDGIPRYLEAMDTTEHGSAIANKTGSLDAVRNDVAAISSRNGLLILSIFTYDNEDHSWSADNEGKITTAKLAKAIVTAWSPQGLQSFPEQVKPLKAASPTP